MSKYTIGCYNADRELIATLAVPEGTSWIRLDTEASRTSWAPQEIELPPIHYVDSPPFYTDADRSYDIHAIGRDHGNGG